ncbi:hypothetical protein EPD60_09135 [Flaviaesturariibacter flavus]|uniref:DUF4296 domain-containing protein n=1 Tax=Flaviaesturariibacter flavus TaxID=2502780 RepID=A0A4R1BB11_9BACT|nr:hypothetical protein [Flaviaesturariibacter flavus]TCJ14160.1 hypothetical protein EPD60_09135 [Flaviaesturariibacter flavus]
MKRFIYILIFSLSLASTASAQPGGPGERIRERMREYLQNRLSLTRAESERFTPVFISYFNELRSINQQYRGDRLVLQQKIVDLRLRYRDQFRPIMGEKRSNDIFVYEHDFVDEVKRIREERMQNRLDNDRTGKRF